MDFDVSKVVYCGEDCTDLLGKLFFYSNDLLNLSGSVKDNDELSIATLVDIDTNALHPFKIKDSGGCMMWVKLLYPSNNKKNICFRPFSDYKELILKWGRVCPSPNKRPPNTMPLIWVKYKLSDNCQLITAFNKDGVEMGAEYMSWKALFDKMTFLDGFPCGIEDEGYVN